MHPADRPSDEQLKYLEALLEPTSAFRSSDHAISVLRQAAAHDDYTRSTISVLIDLAKQDRQAAAQEVVRIFGSV